MRQVSFANITPAKLIYTYTLGCGIGLVLDGQLGVFLIHPSQAADDVGKQISF